MNGLIDRLRREVGRLGGAGVVGIGLLVFAATFYFSAHRPARVELAALNEEARQLQERLRMGGSLTGREAAPAEQLAAFYAFFPNETSTPQWLARIYDAAAAKGIALESGEYKLDRKVGERLARYEILLPVKGSYAQIRGFVAEVLATVPAAVLEEVNLRRESVQSRRLDARVRFTLYLGGAE
ncbi:MAG: type 4a pilus biogenesis protein PilO [Betaproteobacteria bacterium]|jgi:Tfp pilus assembly protein PilO|nr:type 4a pilus biogenesis protein PilO [Betaproteobacteria bacterium]